jgi:hypothetical protein
MMKYLKSQIAMKKLLPSVQQNLFAGYSADICWKLLYNILSGSACGSARSLTVSYIRESAESGLTRVVADNGALTKMNWIDLNINYWAHILAAR